MLSPWVKEEWTAAVAARSGGPTSQKASRTGTSTLTTNVFKPEPRLCIVPKVHKDMLSAELLSPLCSLLSCFNECLKLRGCILLC